jgi:shikimate 5-dehydrogenase
MTGGPAPEQSPIDAAQLKAGPAPLAVETIYTPLRTPFLRAAADAGWNVIDGAALFLRQASAQFELWTQAPPPAALFEQLLRSGAASAIRDKA